jgi:lipopolysaccharide export system protein LptA
MKPIPNLAALALLCVVATGAAAQKAASPGGMLGLQHDWGGRGPITITSATLVYDYKRNVVTYRGDVEAVQGNIRVRSDDLTITLVASGDDPGGTKRPSGSSGAERVTLQEIVATGAVRIEQGERFATGQRAVFDQTRRILLLTGDPVLHDGPNEVAGERVVVYLDEDRSVVEGGRRRVKAVLYPDRADERPRRPRAAPAP